MLKKLPVIALAVAFVLVALHFAPLLFVLFAVLGITTGFHLGKALRTKA